MKNHLAFLILSLILFSSCAPRHDIEFKISNQSNDEISVIRSYSPFNDTIIVAAGSEEIIQNYSGLGNKTNRAYAILDSIPIDFFSIKQNQKEYNKNPKNKSLWSWEESDNGSAGKSILKIVEVDFD
ncbi:MAG: hypothetical protein AB8F94_12880 [Saprospiraceae bacterium]